MEPFAKYNVSGKSVEVFGGAGPAVYLNGFEGEGLAVYGELIASGCPELTLVAISGLEWDRDLAPWDAPPISKGGGAFTGGAGEYLQLLTDVIVPRTEALLPAPAPWRGLAGYSLAGLFALWALWETDAFSRSASVSGPLWFPGFLKFAQEHMPPRVPRRVRLSLGDREHLTRNPALMPVRERTEAVCALLSGLGVDTQLHFNPGSHFSDPEKRTAECIRSLL